MKNKEFMMLQLFAAGDNNNLPVKSYQLEFKNLLQAVFGKMSYFSDFFGGGIEALDGVRENETAFYVKTSDIPVVVGTGYDKTATKGFKTGTGNSSRFGERTEIIYTNTPVDYSWPRIVNRRVGVNNLCSFSKAAGIPRPSLKSLCSCLIITSTNYNRDIRCLHIKGCLVLPDTI